MRRAVRCNLWLFPWLEVLPGDWQIRNSDVGGGASFIIGREVGLEQGQARSCLECGLAESRDERFDETSSCVQTLIYDRSSSPQAASVMTSIFLSLFLRPLPPRQLDSAGH